MHTNIFAYTGLAQSYPEFISVNRESDGQVTVTVRSPATFGMTADQNPTTDVGVTAKMTLPRDQVAALSAALAQLSLAQA